MSAITRAATLPGPISETDAIYRQAASLADALVGERADGRAVTLVGISVSHLIPTPHIQLELPLDGLGADPVVRAGSAENLRHHDLDAAVDRARRRFGRAAITRASTMRRAPEIRSPMDELEAGDG